MQSFLSQQISKYLRRIKTMNGIMPLKDVIVTKTRIYNGKYQYRRWNQTQGYWVDPYWIDLT